MAAKKLKPMYQLELALDQAAYEWLAANASDVLDAVAHEVKAGHQPDEIHDFVMRENGSEDFARKIRQAARHIEREVK